MTEDEGRTIDQFDPLTLGTVAEFNKKMRLDILADSFASPKGRPISIEHEQLRALHAILNELSDLRQDMRRLTVVLDTLAFTQLDDDYRRLTAEFRRRALERTIADEDITLKRGSKRSR